MNALNITLAAILATATLFLTTRDEETLPPIPIFTPSPPCHDDCQEPADQLPELEFAPLVPTYYDDAEPPATEYQNPSDRRRPLATHKARQSILKRFIERFRHRHAQRKEKRNDRRQTRRENRRSRSRRH